MWHHYFLMDSDRFRQLSLVQNLDMQGNVGKHRAWQGFFDFYSLWKTQGAKWFLFFFAAFRADGARRPLVSPPPRMLPPWMSTPMDATPTPSDLSPPWMLPCPMDVSPPLDFTPSLQIILQQTKFQNTTDFFERKYKCYLPVYFYFNTSQLANLPTTLSRQRKQKNDIL